MMGITGIALAAPNATQPDTNPNSKASHRCRTGLRTERFNW